MRDMKMHVIQSRLESSIRSSKMERLLLETLELNKTLVRNWVKKGANPVNIQYCAKVMQTIIDEYHDISAIFNEILP